MTVQELIEKLQQEDPEAQVHFAYPSGDHWRTVLAPKVTHIDEQEIKNSEYHGKPMLIDDEDAEDANRVVVLS